MFFMKCFQKMREEENIQRETEKQQISTTQMKIKRKEERLEALRRLKFLGASSIKEYNELEREIAELKKDDNYSKWFEENKEILSELFDLLFEMFAIRKEKIVYLDYNMSNDIVFNGHTLKEEFLKELLRRYGYSCKIRFFCDRKQKFEIHLEKEF